MSPRLTSGIRLAVSLLILAITAIVLFPPMLQSGTAWGGVLVAITATLMMILGVVAVVSAARLIRRR